MTEPTGGKPVSEEPVNTEPAGGGPASPEQALCEPGSSEPGGSAPGSGAEGKGGRGGRIRWLAPTLPLAVYLLTGLLEPVRAMPMIAENAGAWERFTAAAAIPFDYYPTYYFLRVGLTVAALLVALRRIRAGAAGDWGRWRWSAASLGLGALGTAIWVTLCRLPRWLHAAGAAGVFGDGGGGDIVRWVETALGGFGAAARTGFDPFRDMPGLPGPLWLAIFLAVRFAGLALIVPLAEEFFLRGFLVRFIQREAWWEVPIGVVTRGAVVAMLAYAVITHPGEWLAAVVWFSLVTWWCRRTGNLWDAVQLHMATNFTLGVYVVLARQWWLW